MKKIKFILTGIALLYSVISYAQRYNHHEVSVSAGVGMHKLQYTTSPGNTSTRPGGVIGIGYAYFFSENWGISTGIEGSYYNTILELNEFTSVIHGLNDGQGNDFDFHSTLKDYSETQKAYIVSVPVMATYQTGKFNKFYVAGGVKVGLPFGSYQSTGNFYNKGYFPERDNWAIDQRFMGFGTFDGEESNDKLKYNLSCMLALELGVKWYTGGDWSIYTGIYGDYGLNNINPQEKKEFLQYEVSTNGAQVNNVSALQSQYITSDRETISFTDKVRSISVGLKVRIAMGW